jgi:hypothetical protein
MRWGVFKRASAPGNEKSVSEDQLRTRRRNSPGLEIALSCLPEDGGGRILDMGAASVANLESLMGIAHHVRVVNSLKAEDPMWLRLMERSEVAPDPKDLTRVATALFPDDWGTFDVVLAWDLLNYLTAEGVTALAGRLADLCQPQARLFFQVVAVGDMAALPARYRIVAPDQIEVSPETAARRTPPGWPFAKVERLLSGFEVECSFVMRHGVQEYVAVRI